jgi:hypothetical protein
MRRIFFLSLLIGLMAANTSAQETAGVNKEPALHQQLLELQNKEAQLRMRLEELDEALKPENIERALAGIGSTKPEELREHRRRMLTIERNGLKSQLVLIEESRARTEMAIAAAQSEAYLRSAQPAPTPPMQMAMTPGPQSARALLRLVLLAAAVFILFIAALATIFAGRRIA